jgi:hypothetical protein
MLFITRPPRYHKTLSTSRTQVPLDSVNFQDTIEALIDALNPIFSSQTIHRKYLKCNELGVRNAVTVDALPESLLFVNIAEGLGASKDGIHSSSYGFKAKFYFLETFHDKKGDTWELTGRIHSTVATRGQFFCFTKSNARTPGIYHFNDKVNNGRAKLYSPEKAELIGNFTDSAFVVYIKIHRADKGKLKITLKM